MHWLKLALASLFMKAESDTMPSMVEVLAGLMTVKWGA